MTKIFNVIIIIGLVVVGLFAIDYMTGFNIFKMLFIEQTKKDVTKVMLTEVKEVLKLSTIRCQTQFVFPHDFYEYNKNFTIDELISKSYSGIETTLEEDVAIKLYNLSKKVPFLRDIDSLYRKSQPISNFVVFDALIEAGYDLEKLDNIVKEKNEKEKKIVLKLPEPVILYEYIDDKVNIKSRNEDSEDKDNKEDEFPIADLDEGAWSEIVNVIDTILKKRMMNHNAFKKAKDSAKETIEGFLKQFGYEKIIFEEEENL